MNKSLLIFAAGCIVGLVVGIASDDWRARAVTDEVLGCKDLPDKAAFMIRRPGEGHNTEYCAKIMRFGSPDWVPYFQHPLGPNKDRGSVR